MFIILKTKHFQLWLLYNSEMESLQIIIFLQKKKYAKLLKQIGDIDHFPLHNIFIISVIT